MPIEPGHIRWPVERGKRGDFDKGDLFEVSWLHTTCHGFTHVDAPSHMVPGGATLSDLQLDRVVGTASVISLPDITANEAITPERLVAAAPDLAKDRIIVFRTGWYEQRDWQTEAYWRDSPYLTRAACEWLLQKNPTAVAFDFPQDWTIRCLLDGEVRPIHEHVSHDVLLRNNVTLVEYLINTLSLSGADVLLCAQPLNLPSADGAPARVVAIEQSAC